MRSWTGDASVIDPVWIAAFGTLVSVVTLALNLYFRRRDNQSRLKIEYYLGDEPPREWMEEAGRPITSSQQPVVMFRVENVGFRDESLSGAHLAVPGGGVVRPFSGGNPPMPSPLRPGFPRYFDQSLQGVSHALVNAGCTGTARVHLVVRLGRGKPHKKRIEIPEVEAKAQRGGS